MAMALAAISKNTGPKLRMFCKIAPSTIFLPKTTSLSQVYPCGQTLSDHVRNAHKEFCCIFPKVSEHPSAKKGKYDQNGEYFWHKGKRLFLNRSSGLEYRDDQPDQQCREKQRSSVEQYLKNPLLQ
jgi:hypothetical protein